MYDSLSSILQCIVCISGKICLGQATVYVYVYKGI
jgi:hypothetical protein